MHFWFGDPSVWPVPLHYRWQMLNFFKAFLHKKVWKGVAVLVRLKKCLSVTTSDTVLVIGLLIPSLRAQNPGKNLSRKVKSIRLHLVSDVDFSCCWPRSRGKISFITVIWDLSTYLRASLFLGGLKYLSWQYPKPQAQGMRECLLELKLLTSQKWREARDAE